MFVEKIIVVCMVVAFCFVLSCLADAVIKTKRAD